MTAALAVLGHHGVSRPERRTRGPSLDGATNSVSFGFVGLTRICGAGSANKPSRAMPDVDLLRIDDGARGVDSIPSWGEFRCHGT